MSNGVREIKISEIKQDLENGLTKCKGDAHYNEALGSIEEKYGLAKADVKELFASSPKLSRLRVKAPKSWKLVDDEESNENASTNAEIPSLESTEVTAAQLSEGSLAAAVESDTESADTF